MSRGEKIGVLGGSFAPVHHAHLWVASFIRERFSMQQVVFVPSRYHPFKGLLHDAEHRWQMLQLAIAGEEGFSLSAVEINGKQTAYTYDTMLRLQEKWPDCELYFILGSDILGEVALWHRGEELLRDFHVIGVGRNEEDVIQLIREDDLLSRYRHRICPVNAPFAFDLSSSFIRARLRQGMTIHSLVPPAVENYLRQHRLYLSDDE